MHFAALFHHSKVNERCHFAAQGSQIVVISVVVADLEAWWAFAMQLIAPGSL